MVVEILSGAGSLTPAFRKAAQVMFEVFSQKQGADPLVVGLCGGRSVVGLLQALKEEAMQQPQELVERIHFFMVDERIVPITSDQSNFGMLQQGLFNDLVQQKVLLESQLHPFEATAENAGQSCSEYLHELESFGGKFSVVVLGMGEDGHVAGLFPRHAILSNKKKGFECFFDSPKPPAARMTATRELLIGCDAGILLAVGEGKRSAWNAFHDLGVSEDECPAKMIRAMKRALVVTDLT